MLPDERLEELSEIYRRLLPASRRLRSWMDRDDLEVVMVRSLAEACPTPLCDHLQVAKPAPTKPQPKRKRERRTSDRQRLTTDPSEQVGWLIAVFSVFLCGNYFYDGFLRPRDGLWQPGW